MQKGFAVIYAFVGLLILILVAGGAYYFGRFQSSRPESGNDVVFSPAPKINVSSSPTQTVQPIGQVSPSVIKGDSYTENTAISNQKKYVSPKLGISFLYLAQLGEDKIDVKEVNQKIYVYPSNMAYKDGQSVEVFNKDKANTLAEAIKKQFLKGISEKDCFVEVNKVKFKYYPENYSTAEIAYPKSDDPNIGPGEIPAACPQDYSQTNGIRYFLGDSKHPGKLLFISIGQYPIEAGEGNKLWQDTIQFLD